MQAVPDQPDCEGRGCGSGQPIAAPPPTRYFAAAGTALVVSFALVWAWVAAMPLAYLDPEYPSWRAKLDLVDRCDIGEILILGDSRAAADVLPAALPARATNLAVGGGKPIEAYSALTHALRCPVPPRRVLISLDVDHFMQLDLFWERSVRFGFLTHHEVEDVARVAGALGDWRAFAKRQTDGLPPSWRGALYAARFPPLYFSSLVRGGGFLRWWRNQHTLKAGLTARGQYFFGTAAGSNIIAVDGHLGAFRPLPVLDYYFDRLLALLADRGIRADFVSMPINQSTWREVRPALREAFAAYLADYAARYPDFHLLGPTLPHWPDRLFGDGFSHLNPEGAVLFSAGLGRCLRAEGALQADACDSSTFLTATQAALP